MKATRKNIPTLIAERTEFSNGSGTLRAFASTADSHAKYAIGNSDLSDVEKSRLRIDMEQNGGLAYIVLSYDTPIAWETNDGHVYKVGQTLSQTSEQHKGLLYEFFARKS